MIMLENPFSGKIIQLAFEDFKNKMDWNQAKQFCTQMGEGWRLPDKEEMQLIFSEMLLKDKGKFKHDRYWSATEIDMDNALVFLFYPETTHYYGDYPKEFLYWVRAVRDMNK